MYDTYSIPPTVFSFIVHGAIPEHQPSDNAIRPYKFDNILKNNAKYLSSGLSLTKSCRGCNLWSFHEIKKFK